MPIYEYRCEACGKRSSALLPRYDADDPPCPHCGATSLHRLVSTFATQRSGDSDFGDDLGGADDDFGDGDGGEDWGGDDDY
jgi:putative FmdB family regulatory protein